MHTTQLLSDFSARGIEIPHIDSWAPEYFRDNNVAFVQKIQGRLSLEEIEANYEIFNLCASCESFKDRLSGKIVDDWFTKKNFGKYAQNYYDILARQNDLEEWQVKLMETFKEMI